MENLELKNVIISDVNAAKYLKVTAETIRTWRKQGKIPFTKIGGKFYYDIEKLNQLVYTGINQ
jgi:excisionase family DNA binding protein